MKDFTVVYEIARWEFLRWFKWKDQFLTLLISVGVGLLFWGGMAFLQRGADDPVTIAVIGRELLPIEVPTGSRLTLEEGSVDQEETLRDRVGKLELDGLLVLKSRDEAELLVYKESAWKNELEALLTGARRGAMLKEVGLSSAQLQEMFRELRVKVTIHDAGLAPTGAAEKIVAVIVIVLMLMGTFTCGAYQFVSITGEKQLRITEVIMSAVTAEQWIDGKILGITAYAFANTVTFVLSILVFVGISQAMGSGWSIPAEVANPSIIVLLAMFGLGGFLLWNTINAALAATINDPNTSARSVFLFLPMVPVGLAFGSLLNPDSVGVRFLSLFPLTAPPVMMARMVLTEVAWWEITLALVLLGAAIWLFRTAAGRVFRLGMLMFGKEPSMNEIMRWMRST